MDSETKIRHESVSQHELTEKARKLINDIQEVMTNFQSASKEGRTSDVSALVEQVLQLFSALQSEINASSPASPIPVDSFGSFSDDIRRILQHCEEQDDATSALAEIACFQPEPNTESFQPIDPLAAHDNHFTDFAPKEPSSQEFYQHGSGLSMQNIFVNDSDFSAQLDYHVDFNQDFDCGYIGDVGDVKRVGHSGHVLPHVNPPPSAFLGPKCALWDCQRPAQGSEQCQDYCCSMHADLASSEGSPGMNPVLRPGGIGLKDDRLFSSLLAKMQGKVVGIPECEGAAIERSPWNASKLFDLHLFEGETIREWLFFDKPRRAFESGNRKHRSLSDYNGRGWHESRKQVMKDLGGNKRSYYMDPQPPGSFEWHLFEYEVSSSNSYALYKLEVKHANTKKSPKGKVASDSLVDLQKQMGRLSADISADDNRPVKGRMKTDR